MGAKRNTCSEVNLQLMTFAHLAHYYSSVQDLASWTHATSRAVQVSGSISLVGAGAYHVTAVQDSEAILAACFLFACLRACMHACTLCSVCKRSWHSCQESISGVGRTAAAALPQSALANVSRMHRGRGSPIPDPTW